MFYSKVSRNGEDTADVLHFIFYTDKQNNDNDNDDDDDDKDDIEDV